MWTTPSTTKKSHTLSAISRAAISVTLLALASTPVNALNAPLLHEYFVPIPDEQVRTWAVAIDQGAFPPSNDMRAVISVTVTLDGTRIVYDHWEDGLETAPENPTQGTTEIWGDGLAATGCPPTVNRLPLICTDANDLLGAGDVLALENDVPANPRGTANRFDGGDLLASSDVLAVTRAGWPVNVGAFSGVVLAGAVEVYMTTDWGVRYLSPIGEDIAFHPTFPNQMFEYTAFSIMAGEDATLVSVDVDGDGTIDQSATLDRGESLLAAGVDVGGEVLSTKPVQVGLLTGDMNTTYEARWFALFPSERWSSAYYTPVGETDTGAPVTVILYNPATSDLDVDYETLTTSGSFSVPAGEIYEYTMPTSSGGRFASVGQSAHGMAVWSATSTPENNVWDGSAFIGPTASPPVDMASRWRIIQSAAAPTREEKIVVGIENGGEVSAQRWDGSSWTEVVSEISVGSLGSVSETFWWGAEVAYEQQSGDGVMVWNDGSDLRYSVWDGASWSPDPPQVITSCTSGEPKQMKLAANPKSNEMVLVVNHQNETDCALVWDGSAWGNVVPLSASTSQDRTDIAVAYESLSGDAVVVFEDNTDPDTFYRVWNGSSWTTSFLITAPSGPSGYARWAKLAADPQSDRLALGVLSNDSDIWLAIWNGSGWDTSVEATTTANGTTFPNHAVAFESTSGQALATYGEGSSLRHRTWSGGTWSSELPGGPSIGGASNSMTLDSDPNSDAIMLSVQDGNSNLNYVLWNGSFWGSADELEVNTSETKNQPFSFLWTRFGVQPPPNPPFYALSTIDYDDTTNDWGFSLIPEDFLATAAVVGWAPGSEDLTENGSPVWVTAEADTTLYIDYDGDGLSDATSALTRLQSLRLRDADNDQTGMRIWTEDGTKIAAAWGQEAGVASAGSPSLDLGTAVLPFVNPVLIKQGDLAIDRNGNGVIDPGDTLLYTLTLKNVATSQLVDPTVVDVPDPNVTYEPNTTTLDGVPIADDAGPETPFPLDDAGYTLATMQPGETVVLTYLMTIADPLPTGVWSVQNRATVTAGDGSTSATTPSEIAIPGTRVTKVSDAVSPVLPGQILSYTVTVSNPSPLTAADVFVQDVLPAGTIYVPQSTVAMGPGGVTKDNIPGGANPDLADGSPPDLVLPTDDFDLDSLDTLTVTFQVQVVDSPDPNLTRILNVASASSPEVEVVVSDQVIDPLSPGGEIGDLVWLDVDGDGFRDLGEPGIGNLTVELLDGTCTQGVDCRTTVSDGSGRYAFHRVYPGTYQVRVDETTLPGAPGDLVRAPGTVNPSAVWVITTTEVFRDADFGYISAPNTSVIGDRVWSDADNDGLQDAGEVGLGGVTLDLLEFGTLSVVTTTTTAADGSYLFAGVASGKYHVDVSDTGSVLAGYSLSAGPESSKDPTATIPAKKDTIYLRADFGYYSNPLLSIAETLWLDADADGSRGAAETGISSVTILLVDDSNGNGVRNAGEPVVGSTLSSGNGDVSFTGLEAGDYVIALEDVNAVLVGMAGTTLPAQAFELGVTVGPDYSGVSFGYTKPGAIGDRVWSDGNNDGLEDAGEPGLSGVTVNLWLDDGDGVFDSTVDFIQSSTATDISGHYEFTELEVGGYFVSVDDGQAALTGMAPTTTDQEAGPNAAGTQIEATLQVAAASFLTADFGYRDPSLFGVSGNVFEDLDVDGFDDGVAEPGLTGVTIDLVDPGADVTFGTNDDVTVATATTDAQGDYLFPDVQGSATVPRDYRVEITDAAGRLLDYALTSGLDSIEITISDASISGIDFGYVRDAQTGSIGNSVWLDSNGDGLRALSEAGLTAVVLDLYEDVDGDGVFEPGGDDGAPMQTTVTDTDGRYLFTGLPPGDYFVDVVEATLPTNLIETSYPAGADPAAVIALSESEGSRQANFGYLPQGGTAVLGDRVWRDVDPDGPGPLVPNSTQDSGEIGIAGVDVQIQGPGCAPCTLATGPDGIWLATGLAPGTYMVTFDSATLPSGVSATPTNNDGDDVYNITVAAGDAFVHLDFGLAGGDFATAGDLVWFDTDGDGVNAGELGIEGVTVNLVRDTNGDGAWDPDGVDNSFGTTDDESILATMATDALGAYAFFGVPLSDSGDGDATDGDYLIDVTDIDGALAGLQKTAGLAGVDDNSQADPYALTFTLLDTSELTGDFGYTAAGQFGSIGSLVWRDLNGDGDVDSGEPGIGGVTLELWLDVDEDSLITPGIDNLVRSADTNANGEYEFSSLPHGKYVVDVTDEAGVLSGFSKTTGVAGLDNNSQADPCPTVLDAGTPDDMTADFGYEAAPGFILSISGTVFEDELQDATYDSGSDPQVAGADALLYGDLDGDGELDPGEPLLDSTASSGTGTYSFINLPPGSFIVAVDTDATSVDGYLQTTQAATGGVQPVTLIATDSTGNDFGFWNGGLVTSPVTLAYFEARSDGSFRWMTSTEVGNLGFNLYAVTPNGLERLNGELVVSHVVDSLEPQTYEFGGSGTGGDLFILEDVDIHGAVRHHGPFHIDQAAGSEVMRAEPVGWGKIRQEKAEQRRSRAAAVSVGLIEDLCLGCDRGRASIYPTVLLGVDREGVHRVRYEDLLAAGFDFGGARSEWLALTSRGVPVPMHIAAAAVFGPGDYLEFLGEPVETLYTKTNVYRLAVDRQRASRVETLPFVGGGTPEPFYLETARVETQAQYHFASPTDDPWYDRRLLATSGPVATSIGFDLESWVPGAAPVSLDVALWGGTDFFEAPDHHLVVEINGTQVADNWFDGLSDPEIALEVSDGSLTSSANTMTLRLPHDTGAKYDLVNYDHLEMTYPRAFVAKADSLHFASDGSDFAVSGLTSGRAVAYARREGELRRLRVQTTGQPGAYQAVFGAGGLGEDAEYWVASEAGLRVPTIGAARWPRPLRDRMDVAVVAHADFIAGLEPWVARREAEGLEVTVVDVADLYALYSHDIVDPEAIRRFVTTAANLGARYLQLVGGDTYDYFDHLGVGSISFIPSLYARTDAIVRLAPVDPLYGDIDGDLVPDLAVGRWPVRTTAELAAVIAKTLAYAPTPEALSAVMASDGRDLTSGYSFEFDSRTMADLLGPDWQIAEVSLDQLSVADARQALLDGIGAGPTVTSYFGHSGLTVWSFDGLFGTADIDALTNDGAPTLVTQWGCWNTYHVLPTYETLGNRLLLEPDRGAVAVLGAATLTEALSQRNLGRRVFERLGQPGLRLGDSITAAKQDLALTDPGRLDVLLGWTLLGDPTLTVVP